MLVISSKLSLEAGLGQHAFNLRHQVSILKYITQRRSILTQYTFLSRKSREQCVEQMGITTQTSRRPFAIAFQVNQLF